MIGHPVSAEQAINFHIIAAASHAFHREADSRRSLVSDLKAALQFAFWSSALVFFETDHTAWLDETADMASLLAAHLDTNCATAIPTVEAFLETRVLEAVNQRFRDIDRDLTSSPPKETDRD